MLLRVYRCRDRRILLRRSQFRYAEGERRGWRYGSSGVSGTREAATVPDPRDRDPLQWPDTHGHGLLCFNPLLLMIDFTTLTTLFAVVVVVVLFCFIKELRGS